jgi:5-methylcytosine-specific restriction endonuclease McrA
MLNIARHGTAYHVETLVRKYRRVQMQLDVDRANAIHVRREVSYYWDEDGALVFHGRLPAEQGALILKALEMQMEKTFQEPAEQDVSAETPEEPEARSPVAARRADALAEIAESYMNSGPVANSTADRYQVIVHVSEEATRIEDGPHVSAETSRRIGCDCNVIPIKEDENGEPLSIGRRSRLVPPAIRRALRLRDDGCRFPGCTRKQFVDAHHIEHWSRGGETSLDNLVQLCREHHRLVHEETPESGPCRTGRSCRGATRRTRPSTTCTSASITWASRLIPACRTGMPAIPATGKWLWKGCWRVKRGKLMKYSTGGRMVQRPPCPGT